MPYRFRRSIIPSTTKGRWRRPSWWAPPVAAVTILAVVKLLGWL